MLEAQKSTLKLKKSCGLYLKQIFIDFGRFQLTLKQNQRYDFMRYTSPPFDLIFSPINTQHIQTSREHKCCIIEATLKLSKFSRARANTNPVLQPSSINSKHSISLLRLPGVDPSSHSSSSNPITC